MSSKYNLNIFARLKLYLLLPFFTVGLYLLLVLVIFPFYLYRSVINFVAKWRDLRTSGIITGLSASLLRDYDVQEEKPLSTIVVCLRGRGTMTLSSFREVFRSLVILKMDPKDPQYLQFPELQQYYTTFMGYAFLRWDRSFNLSKHFTTHKTKRSGPIDRKELMEIWEELMVKPFKKQKSPWEVVLVDNGSFKGYPPEGKELPEHYVFIRVHHGIMDGFSVQKMLVSLGKAEFQEVVNSKLKVCNGGTPNILNSNFLMNCRTAIFGPYDLLKHMLLHKEGFHTFHLPKYKLSKEYFIAESEPIAVDQVKNIKKRLGVSFTTILISSVCGGFRMFLKQNGRKFPDLQGLEIPFKTEMGLAETKAGNDFLIAPLKIPIHHTRAIDRIREIQNQLNDLRLSSLPQMLGIVIDSLSCLPINLMRALTKKSLFSAAYSTLPGPTRIIQAPGLRLHEVNFTYGTGAASLGLCFSSITYLDSFRFMILVDKKLIGSRKKAEEMIECVTNELQYLSKLSDSELK